MYMADLVKDGNTTTWEVNGGFRCQLLTGAEIDARKAAGIPHIGVSPKHRGIR